MDNNVSARGALQTQEALCLPGIQRGMVLPGKHGQSSIALKWGEDRASNLLARTSLFV